MPGREKHDEGVKIVGQRSKKEEARTEDTEDTEEYGEFFKVNERLPCWL
jgi:hypothetical protein